MKGIGFSGYNMRNEPLFGASCPVYKIFLIKLCYVQPIFVRKCINSFIVFVIQKNNKTYFYFLNFSLGSDHDGWFRSKQCDPTNGFLMASVAPLAKTAYYFSQCTVNSVKENLLQVFFSNLKIQGSFN